MEKTTENINQQAQSRAAADNTAQRKESSDSALEFVDKRPETATQLRMAEMMKNSPYHGSQNSLASIIRGTAQREEIGEAEGPNQMKGGKSLTVGQRVVQRIPNFLGSMAGEPSGDFVNAIWRQEPQLSDEATPAPVLIDQLQIDQTKHHIIPLRLLREFISAINTNNHLDHVNPLFQTTANTMIANSPLAGDEGEQERMQGGVNLANLTSEIDKAPVEERAGEAFSVIISSFAWMPGNIFIGPINNQRIDDPGENFETHAAAPAGALFATLQLAHGHINAYLDDNDPETAALAVQQLQIIAAQGAFHAYNPQHWTIDELTAANFTFENYDGAQDTLLNDVGLYARKRHMFKLTAAPANFIGNPVVQGYILLYQNLIDQRIAALNAPPPEYEQVSSGDEFDFGGLFGEDDESEEGE